MQRHGTAKALFYIMYVRYNEVYSGLYEAIKLDQQYAEAWYYKGIALYIVGEIYRNLFKPMTTPLELNPQYAEKWNYKALSPQRFK